jgi:hypothetical protein
MVGVCRPCQSNGGSITCIKSILQRQLARISDVGMGMAGIVVIDRDSIEASIGVSLHLPHEIAGTETAGR